MFFNWKVKPFPTALELMLQTTVAKRAVSNLFMQVLKVIHLCKCLGLTVPIMNLHQMLPITKIYPKTTCCVPEVVRRLMYKLTMPEYDLQTIFCSFAPVCRTYIATHVQSCSLPVYSSVSSQVDRP